MGLGVTGGELDMKHLVSELEGALLDAAVAKALGFFPSRVRFAADGVILEVLEVVNPLGPVEQWVCYSPSSNWAQGGLILEHERIQVDPESPMRGGTGWRARCQNAQGSVLHCCDGKTPLLAAMRVFVLMRLGGEVEL